MKLFTLISLSLLFTSFGFSQIKKKQFLAGGTISFESIKNDNSGANVNESNNFYVSPNVGYFVFDKLAGGLRLDFAFYNSRSLNVETLFNSTTVSPFIRYYFLSKANKV